MGTIIILLGEMIIIPEGYTLGENEEYYEYKYSSRTYLYYSIGFFTVPIGTIIFLLFNVEYKKNENSELNNEKSHFLWKILKKKRI